MNKNTTQIIGKTIKSIDSDAINVWTVVFEDGSSIELCAEADGPLGLGQLWLDNFKQN
jgi:hypothetical protein